VLLRFHYCYLHLVCWAHLGLLLCHDVLLHGMVGYTFNETIQDLHGLLHGLLHCLLRVLPGAYNISVGRLFQQDKGHSRLAQDNLDIENQLYNVILCVTIIRFVKWI